MTDYNLYGALAPSFNAVDASLTVGMRFSSSVNGNITALKIYNVLANTDPIIGLIYSAAGAELGRVTMTYTPGVEGWVTTPLATPIPVIAGTTYIVAAFFVANFPVFLGFHTGVVTSGVLTAPANTGSVATSGNGLGVYSAMPTFPGSAAANTSDTSGNGTDVVFSDVSASTSYADVSDFVGGTFPTGTVSFSAGQTTQTVTVAVQGDGTTELDETFVVTLTNPTGCTIV